MHEERARAESFGADAEAYDRTRPRYPAEMIDDLVALAASAPPRVLDVGCGTGIVAEAFAARGCDVLGVEIDPRMAAVATRKGLAVEVARFEEWDGRGRTFDLVVSGQAWHWVDPVAGQAKAASVLVPGGTLAVFWNRGTTDDETQAALDEVYARLGPELRTSFVHGRTTVGDDLVLPGDASFEGPEVRRYRRTQRYTTAEWVALLPTHSDHRLLPEPVRATLLDGVAAALDARGGAIDVTYETVVVSARRR